MSAVRKTKLVNILLDQFKNTNQGVSVTTFMERLSTEMNKTTVYRILERLVCSRTLHRINNSKQQIIISQIDFKM